MSEEKPAPRIPTKEEVHEAFVERIRAIMFRAPQIVQRDFDMLTLHVKAKL